MLMRNILEWRGVGNGRCLDMWGGVVMAGWEGVQEGRCVGRPRQVGAQQNTQPQPYQVASSQSKASLPSLTELQFHRTKCAHTFSRMALL